jgi:hypothetical protein
LDLPTLFEPLNQLLVTGLWKKSLDFKFGGAEHGKNGFLHITGEEVVYKFRKWSYKFIQIMCKMFVKEKV